MSETYLKPREVSEWLGIHVNTVKRMSTVVKPFFRVGARGIGVTARRTYAHTSSGGSRLDN